MRDWFWAFVLFAPGVVAFLTLAAAGVHLTLNDEGASAIRDLKCMAVAAGGTIVYYFAVGLTFGILRRRRAVREQREYFKHYGED